MVEAAVTFALIFLGLAAWAAAVLARRFYRGRPVRLPGDGDPSFLATLFSDGARSDVGRMHHGSHQQTGHHDGPGVSGGGHHGGDFGGGHHGGDFGGGGGHH